MVDDEIVYELHPVLVTSLEHFLPVLHGTIRLVKRPTIGYRDQIRSKNLYNSLGRLTCSR